MNRTGNTSNGNTRWRGLAAAGVLLTAVTLALAGCGGGSSGKSVASVTASASASASPSSSFQPGAFAKCMRENGVADFPDPDANGQYDLPKDIDPTSQSFKDAQQKCQQYNGPGNQGRPADAWAKADQLKYAACMRQNGIPNFPDPDASGGVQLPSGVDPNSTTVKKAEAACKSFGPKNQPTRNGGGGS